MVTIYHPDKEMCKNYNAEHKDLEHYPLYKLPPNIEFSSDDGVIKKATLFIQGTNPWEFDKIYPDIVDKLRKNKAPIVNVIKGLTNSPRGLILRDLEEVYGIERYRLEVASGDRYTEQIIERKISGLEIAARDPSIIPRLVKLFTTGYIFSRQAIIPTDVSGVQLGGALKNIYALCMGLVEGYFKEDLGGNVDNTLFHLSNRFFKEMVSIGVKLGGQEPTFNGLSGLTDFMLACFGSDSRDRRYGYELVSSGAMPTKMTNGYHGLKAIPNLVQLNLESYPVLTSAYEVVIGNKNISEAIQLLEARLSRV